MPSRPCLECGTLTTNSSRCDLHEREFNSLWNRQRGSATARGYGYRWVQLRNSILADYIAAHGGYCNGYQVDIHYVDTTQLTVDHIVPKARGGTDDRSNLQVLCRACNSRKRDRR
ncbi:HNH endonuclease [Kitasatospora sp. MAP12-9]